MNTPAPAPPADQPRPADRPLAAERRQAAEHQPVNEPVLVAASSWAERPEPAGAVHVMAATSGDAAATGAVPPGWYPDPTGRYDFRWWRGACWDGAVRLDGRPPFS